jgi:hypothetical protein
MIVLGEFDGYTLTVNQSAEPGLVTYHIWQDGEDKALCREDCIVDRVFGPSPDEYLYTEAARRYNARGRPDAGPWESLDE